MAGRLSLKEAARLGILVPGGPEAATGVPKPRKAPGKPLGPRKAHKRGRHRRDIATEPFVVIVKAPLEPVTKHRARTQIDRRQIMAAFDRAKGSRALFEQMLSEVKHRSYTPDNTKAFEDAVARIGSAAMRGRAPITGPIDLAVVFTLTGDPEEWPTDVTDPDLDNALKAALDALNGVVFKDDRIIVRSRSIKLCGREPSIHITIRQAGTDILEP